MPRRDGTRDGCRASASARVVGNAHGLAAQLLRDIPQEHLGTATPAVRMPTPAETEAERAERRTQARRNGQAFEDEVGAALLSMADLKP